MEKSSWLLARKISRNMSSLLEELTVFTIPKEMVEQISEGLKSPANMHKEMSAWFTKIARIASRKS